MAIYRIEEKIEADTGYIMCLCSPGCRASDSKAFSCSTEKGGLGLSGPGSD